MNAPILSGLLPVAGAVAAIAINALWQDALIVAGVWALLRAWPRLNAATRYTVWSATLVAAVVVPVATTLPFIAAPLPPVSTIAGVAQGSRTPILSSRAAAHHAEPSVVRGAGGGVAGETLPRVSPIRFPERFRLTLPAPLAIAIFAAWVLLAAAALARLAIGILRLEQLKRDALPLPVEYRDAMRRWCGAEKGSRDVRLCVSDEIDVPVAVGLFDSMILIPRVLLEQLSEAEVDQISLHELAHLRRADDWSNGLQRVLLAVLAWNPAARFAGAQLDLEREVACDDYVLNLTGEVRPYALCLTKMAETSSWPRAAVAAPGVFATRKHISLRIERLLGAGRNIATGLSFAPAAAAMATVGALAFAIAVVAPSIAAPLAEPAAEGAAAASAQTAAAASPRIASHAANEAPGHALHASAQQAQAAAATVAQAPAPPSAPARAETVAPPAPPVPQKAMPAAAAPRAPALGRAWSSNAVASAAQTCTGCSFQGVDWSGRDMRGVAYTGSDLSNAKLRGTNFSGASFSGVDFSKADLRGASFRDAKLVGDDFSHADLTGVDFTGATLQGSDFTDATLSSANLRSILGLCTGCDFTQSRLAGIDLSGVDVKGADFSKADLRNANLGNSTFTSVDFSGALMSGVNLAGTTLNGCDLSGVDLSRVDLSKTHLIGIDFSRHDRDKR